MAAFDKIVHPTLGDYVDIDAAVAALSAPYSLLVKKATYADSVTTSDTPGCFIKIEAGAVFQSTFTVSGNKTGVLFGNGCDIQGRLTISGTDCAVRARNGLTTEGLGISGARSLFDGGGWGTIHDDADDQGIDITAADVIVQNCVGRTNTGANLSAVELSGAGDRVVIRNVKVDAATGRGLMINASAVEVLVEGCHLSGATLQTLWVGGLRGRIIGNHIQGDNDPVVNIASGGDDSAINGNIIVQEDTNENGVDIDAAAENCVVVGNRVLNSAGWGTGTPINDSSGTSTVSDNDIT